jgi:antibiotic biosynthesis monooxygenase (ABM) superfamily enzyme
MNDTPAMTSAGAAVTCRVAPGDMAAFEAVLRTIMATGAAFPGHISGEVLRGALSADGRDYHVLFRFVDEAQLEAWMHSPERQALIREIDPFRRVQQERRLTGLEAWFDLPVAGQKAPSRDRMAFVTWLAIWPLVSLALWQLTQHLGALPFLLRTAVTTIVVTLAMTYLVMPRVVRIAAPWLTPA